MSLLCLRVLDGGSLSIAGCFRAGATGDDAGAGGFLREASAGGFTPVFRDLALRAGAAPSTNALAGRFTYQRQALWFEAAAEHAHTQ